jgi:hypothetical protein
MSAFAWPGINAWCDLALVAGFAEGRHELDAEFIDMVIAAQGGSLEDLQSEASLTSPPPVPAGETLTPDTPTGGDGLAPMVTELSGRLTRLEGLVLEMTSQLVPAINRILSKASNSEKPVAEDHAASIESNSTDAVSVPDDSPPPPKRRLLRLWE